MSIDLVCTPTAEEDALTPRELAVRWRITEKTLSRWRSDRLGPAYLKLGRRVVYPLSEVQSFERRHSQFGAAPRLKAGAA